MKYSKKKLVSLLLVFVMLLSMVPAMSIVASAAAVDSNGVQMSDEFCKPLTDGKLVFKYVKPTGEASWLIQEGFCMENPGFYFDPTVNFSDDFSKLDLYLNKGSENEEHHVVDVVWDYDANVLKLAQSIVDKFPKDRDWFNVTDMEFINFLTYDKSDFATLALANYSGELRSILDNKNFTFEIEARAGSGGPYYTEEIGTAKLMYDDTTYYLWGWLGATAKHAIYVPNSTEDTKAALIAAAQKRIDDYIGKDIVKITATDEIITDYINSEISCYDEAIANAQSKLDAELAKPEDEQNKDFISIYESSIRNYNRYKNEFISEDGCYYFLNKAVGNYVFNVNVAGKDSDYKFVIIKDDKELTVPSYTTVDVDTNVSVKTDSTKLPLDTVVMVEKITEGNAYDNIIETLNVEDGEIFDIKLHSASCNEYITRVDDGQFEVKLPIPERFKDKDLVVYYINDDGNVTEYDVTVKDGFALFTTDHFSIYTLAPSDPTDTGDGDDNNDDKDTNKTPNTDKDKDTGATQTGDSSNLWIWVALLILSGACVFAIVNYRRRKRMALIMD